MTNEERDRCVRLIRDILARHVYGMEDGDPANPNDTELVEIDRLLAGATTKEETP